MNSNETFNKIISTKSSKKLAFQAEREYSKSKDRKGWKKEQRKQQKRNWTEL